MRSSRVADLSYKTLHVVCPLSEANTREQEFAWQTTKRIKRCTQSARGLQWWSIQRTVLSYCSIVKPHIRLHANNHSYTHWIHKIAIEQLKIASNAIKLCIIVPTMWTCCSHLKTHDHFQYSSKRRGACYTQLQESRWSVSSTLNTIGLRDIATKPAEDTLTTFIDLLEDLDEAQEDTGWPKDSVKYYNI